MQKKIDEDLNLDYEIIQHGMSSWSPLLELNWLIKKGLSFKPKSVVLFLCINDFYQDYFRSDLAYTKETVFDLDGYPKEFNISVHSDKYLSYSNLGRCYFYDFFIKQYYLFIKNQRKPKSGLSNLDIDNILSVKSKDFPKYFAENYANVEQYNHHIKNVLELTRPVELWDKDLVENINISLDYIDKINSMLKNNGSELIVALTPLPWNINLKENYKGRQNYLFENIVLPMGGIEEKIVEFCKSNKIEYLDIYKNLYEIKKMGKNKFIFLVSDGHWSEFGHKLVGSLLYDFYKNRFKK